jgi:hypothetical protein
MSRLCAHVEASPFGHTGRPFRESGTGSWHPSSSSGESHKKLTIPAECDGARRECEMAGPMRRRCQPTNSSRTRASVKNSTENRRNPRLRSEKEDLDFVTRLEQSGQTADAAEPFRNREFAAARLLRFSGPRSSWTDRSSRRVSRAVAGPPTDRGCKAAIQGAAAHRRIRRRDQGHTVGDESASRNRKFESTPL